MGIKWAIKTDLMHFCPDGGSWNLWERAFLSSPSVDAFFTGSEMSIIRDHLELGKRKNSFPFA